MTPPTPRQVILRFSDLPSKDGAGTIDTIAEHKAVADANQPSHQVWWGWWKKGSEEEKIDALKAFQARVKLVGEVVVGLLDRELEPEESASRLFVARCHEVAYSPAGQQDRSPNPDWTPDYYNTDEHPAWFLLSHIRSVSREQWDALFSNVGMVLGNSTLYWVEDGKPGRQFPPAPQIRDVKVDASAIIHLSDLHYGASHHFDAPRATPSEDMVASVVSAIEKLDLPKEYAAVVLSGDFTTAGDVGALHHDASREVSRLARELGVDLETQVLLVPGNHDIQLEHGNKRYSQEDDYADFLTMVLGTAAGDDLEQGRRFECSDGWTVTLIGFNSVKPREWVFKDYGYVGKDRVETMVRELEPRDRQSHSIVMAVLHHHLHPVERFVAPDQDRKASLCLDAGELVELFQENEVDVVLHGHQHIPFVGRAERSRRSKGALVGHQDGPLWLLGAGSAGSRELPTGGSNSFSVYSPTDDGLRVRIVEYGPHRTAEVILDDVLPLRRVAGGGRAASGRSADC